MKRQTQVTGAGEGELCPILPLIGEVLNCSTLTTPKNETTKKNRHTSRIKTTNLQQKGRWIALEHRKKQEKVDIGTTVFQSG